MIKIKRKIENFSGQRSSNNFNCCQSFFSLEDISNRISNHTNKHNTNRISGSFSIDNILNLLEYITHFNILKSILLWLFSSYFIKIINGDDIL